MAAALDDHSPDEIFCNSEVFDIDFHPAADIVALGTISGVVQVCVLVWSVGGATRATRLTGHLYDCWLPRRYKYSEEANTQVLELKHHLDAVRGVLFAPDGQSAWFILHQL